MNAPTLTEQPTQPSTTSYITAAQQGHHTWWRYLIGAIIVFIFWILLGAIPTLVVAFGYGIFVGDINRAFELVLPNPPPDVVIPAFLALMVSFIPFLIAVLGVVRFLHNRPVRTLVTGQPQINWRRFRLGFGLWTLLLLVYLGVDILVRPELYTFQFNWAQWIPYTLLALLLIPIQSGTEELFFRGYLMQATSVFTRNPLLLMIPSSLLFAGLHGANPEVNTNFWLVMSYYVLFAFFAAWISLKDGTIELALGMHIANNLSAIISTFPDSALPAPALIIKSVFEPALDVPVFILMAFIFYVVAFRGKAFSGVPSNPAPPAAPAE